MAQDHALHYFDIQVMKKPYCLLAVALDGPRVIFKVIGKS